jgi:hypothetical protein
MLGLQVRENRIDESSHRAGIAQPGRERPQSPAW